MFKMCLAVLCRAWLHTHASFYFQWYVLKETKSALWQAAICCWVCYCSHTASLDMWLSRHWYIICCSCFLMVIVVTIPLGCLKTGAGMNHSMGSWRITKICIPHGPYYACCECIVAAISYTVNLIMTWISSCHCTEQDWVILAWQPQNKKRTLGATSPGQPAS